MVKVELYIILRNVLLFFSLIHLKFTLVKNSEPLVFCFCSFSPNSQSLQHHLLNGLCFSFIEIMIFKFMLSCICVSFWIFCSIFVPLISSTMNSYSVQFSRSVMSDSLWPHEPQHARPPCPSPTSGVCPKPCPSSQWCHPAISSSVVPVSSCPQSFPASGSFPLILHCYFLFVLLLWRI